MASLHPLFSILRYLSFIGHVLRLEVSSPASMPAIKTASTGMMVVVLMMWVSDNLIRHVFLMMKKLLESDNSGKHQRKLKQSLKTEKFHLNPTYLAHEQSFADQKHQSFERERFQKPDFHNSGGDNCAHAVLLLLTGVAFRGWRRVDGETDVQTAVFLAFTRNHNIGTVQDLKHLVSTVQLFRGREPTFHFSDLVFRKLQILSATTSLSKASSDMFSVFSDLEVSAVIVSVEV